MSYGAIVGTGGYLPERIVTNKDLEELVDTDDDWIRARTGISQRHIVTDDETTCDLAEQAALRAIESAGIAADDIDLIIVGTTTPDRSLPATAAILQGKLGIGRGPGRSRPEEPSATQGIGDRTSLPTKAAPLTPRQR